MSLTHLDPSKIKNVSNPSIFFPGGTAGGQTVTLSGQGFSDDMTATICGVACNLKTTTSTNFECRTSANSGMLVKSVYFYIGASMAQW